jgi:hypothetical protein
MDALWYNASMEHNPGYRIETSLPIEILIQPDDQPEATWQPFGIGPGYFQIPDDAVAQIVIQGIDDQVVKILVEELRDVLPISVLNLSENRRVENPAMRWIAEMSQLTHLNLSACGLNDRGIDHIVKMSNLTHLDISYCTRITDIGLKKLKNMRNLEDLYIRGIPKIKHASVKWLERHDLTIRR